MSSPNAGNVCADGNGGSTKSKRRHTALKSKRNVAPPEFDAFNDAFKKLDTAQQASFVDMFRSGEMSAEEAQAHIREMSDNAWLVKYLGSAPVAAAKLTATMWDLFGDQVIAATPPRLKELKMKQKESIITVSTSGIRVIDVKSEEVIENEPLDQVVYAAVSAHDKTHVAFLSHYSKLGLIYCHLFTTKDKNCRDIASAIQKLVAKKPVDEVTEADRHTKATGATLGIFEIDFTGSKDLPKKLTDATLEELRLSAKSKKKKHQILSDRVVMVISSEGIRIVDAISREVIISIYITKISYVTTVTFKKDHYFALISKDDRLKTKICRLFKCRSDEANLICLKVKEAFKVAQEDMKTREGNPFIPMSTLTDPIKGDLVECQIPRRDLQAIQVLGAGQFGEVYLAHQVQNDCKVLRAVKMLRGAASGTDKAEFLGEAAIMQQLKHINIVELVGICAQHRPWLVVLEFCVHGDLQSALSAIRWDGNRLPFGEQLRIAADIAAGLEFVASKRFVHLDVACRNCLISEDGTIKVADFGLARSFDDGKPHYQLRKTLKLSIRWVALEALQPPPKLLSEYSDVWSFGVTMWEISTYGKLPYAGYRIGEVQKLIRQGLRLDPVEDTPQELYSLMSRCWRATPSERPTFSDMRKELLELLKSHPATVNIAKSQKLEPVQFEELLKQYDYPETC